MHPLVLACAIVGLLLGAEAFTHPREISKGNPFGANLAKRIDFEDELLNQALWAGVPGSPFDSRVSLPRTITYKVKNRKRDDESYLFPFPNCLKCHGKAKIDSGLSVEKDFMADQMVTKMLAGAKAGPCLFYGQRSQGSRPASLSGKSKELRCNKWFQSGSARTIWEEREPWSRLYFQQMSEAMAMTCYGDVFVLHDRPDDLMKQFPGKEPSIWITHEFPMLKQLYKRGTVKRLRVVPTISSNGDGSVVEDTYVDKTQEFNKNFAREIEWDEDLAKRLKMIKEFRRSAEYSDPNNATDQVLEKRWMDCQSGTKENPNLDYFG